MSGEIDSQVLKAENDKMNGWANPQIGNYDGPYGPATETMSFVGNALANGTKAVAQTVYTYSNLDALAKIPHGSISADPV